MRIILPVLFLSFFLFGCSPKVEKHLVGKWKMQTILDRGEDVSADHNPANNRWITFYADKSFKSGGDPYGDNSGKWQLDPKEPILYLDSDSGEDDDSYWILSGDKNEMTWQGTKFDFAKRFKIVLVKAD